MLQTDSDLIGLPAGSVGVQTPGVTTPDEIKTAWLACSLDPLFFIDRYVQIYDSVTERWIPFRLWPSQIGVLDDLQSYRLTVILKARQLGQTWLLLAWGLWRLIFHPIQTGLVFSRRDDESMYLLGKNRLLGMIKRLPYWVVPRITTLNRHEIGFSTGSWIRAFPTSAGDSYTATFALVDEADLVPDLGDLLKAVKPTIDAGGHMSLLSRVNKDNYGASIFQRTYEGARQGKNDWRSVFLPWYARPDRDEAWYQEQVKESLENHGSLDMVHEQYPATEEEALSPRSLDKRIPAEWARRCYQEELPVDAGGPAIDGLEIYRAPQEDRRYVLGVDPAEGNPTSDDSSLTVLDADSGEEAASLSGKYQPATLAAHAAAVARWYLKAEILVERNNHGHAVLLWLSDNTDLNLLPGLDGKPGWLTNSLGKTRLLDELAEQIKDQGLTIHNRETFYQVVSIDGSTLKAPDGKHDDRALSLALANMARLLISGGMGGVHI
jgi:hypothetical protein